MVHVFHPLVPLHNTGSHKVFEHVLQSPSVTFFHAMFYYLAIILQLIVLVFFVLPLHCKSSVIFFSAFTILIIIMNT